MCVSLDKHAFLYLLFAVLLVVGAGHVIVTTGMFLRGFGCVPMWVCSHMILFGYHGTVVSCCVLFIFVGSQVWGMLACRPHMFVGMSVSHGGLIKLCLFCSLVPLLSVQTLSCLRRWHPSFGGSSNDTCVLCIHCGSL